MATTPGEAFDTPEATTIEVESTDENTPIDIQVVTGATAQERAAEAGVTQQAIEVARRNVKATLQASGSEQNLAFIDRAAANEARLQLGRDQRSAAQRAEQKAA